MSDVYQVFRSGLSHEGVGREKTRKGLIFLQKGEVKDWESLIYELKDGDYTDYQNETKGMRLCSSKLRDILEAQKSDRDIFQWLDATVQFGGESRAYHVLHFPEPPDLLNLEKCTYAKDGQLIVPRLSREKCEPYNVFNLEKRNTSSFYIRENVRQTIKKEKCTGMLFEKIKLVD